MNACPASVAYSVRSSSCRSINATTAPAIAMIVTHISMLPSWLPQVPAILKISGLAEWLLSTTSFTERSVVTNNMISAPNEISTRNPCMTATGRTSPPSATPLGRSANAPATSCNTANAAAIHKMARPSSAIIGRGLQR